MEPVHQMVLGLALADEKVGVVEELLTKTHICVKKQNLMKKQTIKIQKKKNLTSNKSQ